MQHKISEIRQRTTEELAHDLRAAEEHLRDLRFRLSGARLKNVRQIREARRQCARLRTVLSQKRANT
jgi:ribosomal protein L29